MSVSDLPAWFVRVIAFVFGALWGSFFNVAIHRWPRGMSVVSPASHCPHCKAPIPAWRNVPIIGYLLLRGRTACCHKRLNPRYAVVELISAVLCVALVERYVVNAPENTMLTDAALSALLFFAFVGGLLIATGVDLEWFEIPDEVSIGGTALGLATVTFRESGPDVASIAIGAGAGFLFVQVALVWGWERVTGRRAMGEGDPKFLMFIGAFLGWEGALFALFAGALQGTVVAVIATIARRNVKRSAEAHAALEREASDGAPTEAPETEAGGDAPSLELTDGTVASLEDDGRYLKVEDAHQRLLWHYEVEDEQTNPFRRALPFGPFLALGALEFLFFGDRLVDLYLGLF